jgi:hypothetical protein
MRIQVSKRENFARVNKWIEVCFILYNMFRSFDDKWDDKEPEEDDEPEVEEESNFGTFYCFNLRQRIQSRLLEWYLNIHYASSSAVALSSLLSNCVLTTFKKALISNFR